MTSAVTAKGPTIGGDAQSRTPWLQTSLDTTRSCIRILRLHKGSGITPVVCDLDVASLNDLPYYEALSYVWGDPKMTRSITVGGVTFNATANLFDFLHSLRLPTADRFLWADAICIDQTNEREKIYQIKLMTKIYRYAAETHIWFGPFHKDWDQKIAGEQDYALLCEMTPNMLKDYNRISLGDLKYFKEQEGFAPMKRGEFEDFKRHCLDDIFLQTLAMLDMMAEADGKEHLYAYPAFFCNKDDDGDGKDKQYEVNVFWILVMDCIRWLLTRPWWTRVWTLQEAVLPRADPTVHAPPYSFKLSRLLDGIQAMMYHNGSVCCKLFGRAVMTQHRDFGRGSQYTQPLAIHRQREALNDPCQEWVPLEYVVESIQERKATETRDHWFGIFGLLPPDWQAADNSYTESWTNAELFTKCSKLLYGDCKDLSRLDLARRLRDSKVPDLPSWTIDLSALRTEDEIDYKRWMLYDAARGTEYEGVRKWQGLEAPDLSVKAVRVGTVFTPGVKLSLGSRKTEESMLNIVLDWHKLYCDSIQPADEDAFWRAVFMDRDIWRHWMHKRTNPLYKPRLEAIKKWFDNWKMTGDDRDLDNDMRAGGTTRGGYHYRELDMNVKRAKFFLMSDGVPGMGPHETQAEDEVYAIAGCRSLAVLRRQKWDGIKCFNLVGLCFVDGWMYGRATQGSPTWDTLQLH